MYNFGEKLSLNKLIEISTIGNPDQQNMVEPFFLDIYLRILEYGTAKGYLEEMTTIQEEYFDNSLMLGVSNFEKKKYSYEKSVSKQLRLNMNITLENKNDQFAVLNCYKSEYKRTLHSELSKYRIEDLIAAIYSISSLMSYISFTTSGLFKYDMPQPVESNKYLGLMNLIVDSLGVMFRKEKIWVNRLLGGTKKTCEYLINLILNEEIQFSSSKQEIDIEQIFVYAETLVDTIILLRSLDSLNKMNYPVELREGLIYFDSDLIDRTYSYVNNEVDDTLDLFTKEAEELLTEFEMNEGYTSKIFEDYSVNFENRELYVEPSMNTVEDKFLYIDLIKASGYGYEAIYKSIDALCLSKCDNIEKSTFSTNNRIFKTPIIKVDNYYLLSNHLLMESSRYFRYRILRNELTTVNSFKKSIEEKYDELELNDLLSLIEKNEIYGGINLHLDNISGIKDLIRPKGISKEIDFYFIHQCVLYTMEYKNQEIDSNLNDICKSYSRNIQNKSKHLRMVEIMRKKLPIMKSYFNADIQEIRSFIVFKKKNSFSEFYQGEDIYTCSYSDFRDFCEALFKYNDFESICDGFLFFK